MLILTRRIGEVLMIENEVKITILGIRGQQVRIGVDAPKHVAVHRKEIFDLMQQDSTIKQKDIATDPLAKVQEDDDKTKL